MVAVVGLKVDAPATVGARIRIDGKVVCAIARCDRVGEHIAVDIRALMVVTRVMVRSRPRQFAWRVSVLRLSH